MQVIYYCNLLASVSGFVVMFRKYWKEGRNKEYAVEHVSILLFQFQVRS
jgi:hypothetical protein